MPKLNVYVPDDLAVAVRAAGIPVSPVCQQALREALTKVEQVRRAVGALRTEGIDCAVLVALGTRMEGRFTERLRSAIELAVRAAGDKGVGAAELLIGVLDQGDNLGFRLLEGLSVDPEELRNPLVALTEASSDRPGQATATGGRGLWDRISMSGRTAFANAIEAGIDLGHNYLGCEHLVLGIARMSDEPSAGLLASLGADAEALRRSLIGAAAGFSQARALPAPNDDRLDEVLRRLDALEQRIASHP